MLKTAARIAERIQVARSGGKARAEKNASIPG